MRLSFEILRDASSKTRWTYSAIKRKVYVWNKQEFWRGGGKWGAEDKEKKMSQTTPPKVPVRNLVQSALGQWSDHPWDALDFCKNATSRISKETPSVLSCVFFLSTLCLHIRLHSLACSEIPVSMVHLRCPQWAPMYPFWHRQWSSLQLPPFIQRMLQCWTWKEKKKEWFTFAV